MSLVLALGIFTGCSKSAYTMSDVRVGDDLTFGKYQGEEIEWEVLSRNFLLEEGKVRVQLLSKYALDCQPFNEDGRSSWEDCSLREWLNDDFYNSAFSKSEKKQIVKTTYFNYTGDVRYLSDNVYLISYLWYRFRADEALCKPTVYAEDQGVETQDGNCRYWGRDILNSTSIASTKSHDFAMVFDYDGDVTYGTKDDSNFEAETIGIRPVINIEFKTKIDKSDIKTGDVLTFASYEGNPIEWLVVDKDKSGVTLLSRYGLDDMRMDRKVQESFEDTELYEWLNDDFYKAAFSKRQQKKLVEFDEGGYVSLVSKELIMTQLKNSDNLKREATSGYSMAFYEDHPELEDKLPSEQKVLDLFWLSDLYPEKGEPCIVFNMSRFGIRVPPDKEYSVRPMIKISI